MKGYFYRHEREESGGYGWIEKGLPLLTGTHGIYVWNINSKSCSCGELLWIVPYTIPKHHLGEDLLELFSSNPSKSK